MNPTVLNAAVEQFNRLSQAHRENRLQNQQLANEQARIGFERSRLDLDRQQAEAQKAYYDKQIEDLQRRHALDRGQLFESLSKVAGTVPETAWEPFRQAVKEFTGQDLGPVVVSHVPGTGPSITTEGGGSPIGLNLGLHHQAPATVTTPGTLPTLEYRTPYESEGFNNKMLAPLASLVGTLTRVNPTLPVSEAMTGAASYLQGLTKGGVRGLSSLPGAFSGPNRMAESRIALQLGQARNANANADYTSGAKTQDTQANTDKMKATTDEIRQRTQQARDLFPARMMKDLLGLKKLQQDLALAKNEDERKSKQLRYDAAYKSALSTHMGTMDLIAGRRLTLDQRRFLLDEAIRNAQLQEQQTQGAFNRSAKEYELNNPTKPGTDPLAKQQATVDGLSKQVAAASATKTDALGRRIPPSPEQAANLVHLRQRLGEEQKKLDALKSGGETTVRPAFVPPPAFIPGAGRTSRPVDTTGLRTRKGGSALPKTPLDKQTANEIVATVREAAASGHTLDFILRDLRKSQRFGVLYRAHQKELDPRLKANWQRTYRKPR